MNNRIHLILLCLLLIISGCSYKNVEEKTTSLDLDTANPSQLVEIYYKSLQSKDFETAKKCLSDDYKEKINTKVEFDNLVTLKDLKVSPAKNIKLYGNNYDEVQVIAEYNATYKKVMGSTNGSELRVIYLGKKDKNSLWKIISIGTGP